MGFERVFVPSNVRRAGWGLPLPGGMTQSADGGRGAPRLLGAQALNTAKHPEQRPMRSLDSLFDALARSRFRSRFELGPREQADLDRHGLDTIRVHAARFVDERLAPAGPVNDGKQTPMRNHPVFVAQHATATCCRHCLAKWHGIAPHRLLSDAERRYICDVIMAWLARRYDPAHARAPRQAELF